MATITRFEELEVWQLAREVCRRIYALTSKPEFAKDYSLKDQVRRASGSVMDNIAEGFEREGKKEFLQFLSIARGSCSETKSQLYRALDQEYISTTDFEQTTELIAELNNKLRKLMTYLKQTELKGLKYKPNN